MVEQYSKIVKRESNLIIYSAFIGAFMGAVINKLLDSKNFLFGLTMVALFIAMLYITVPRIIKNILNDDK